MDPINGAGAVDYSMLAQQYQQNNNKIQGYEDDYATMPMVYEPEPQPVKKGAGLGTVLLVGGLSAAAGIWGGKAWGAKGLKDAELKVEEALKRYETVAKENETMKTSLNEYREAGFWKRTWRRFYPNYGLSAEEKAAKKAARSSKKAAAEETKATEKASETAEKTE